MRNQRPPNRINYLRRSKHMSMAELAAQADTTASTVNKLEKGYMGLTQRWMTRLARALGVRPVELIVDTPPPSIYVDARLLGIALRVAEAVLEGEPEEVRAAAVGEFQAAAYDVLVEANAEGAPIDDTMLNTLIATNRRHWLRLKGSDGS